MTKRYNLVLPYVEALRVIGRHLDEEAASDAHLVEQRDGFVVRFHPRGERDVLRETRFTLAQLRTTIIRYAGERVFRADKRPQASMNGHQNLLRVIGSILDGEGAHGLDLADGPEGVSVSYGRGSADRCIRTQLLISPEEVATMMQQAPLRRERLE